MAKEKAKHDGLLCFLLALIVVLIIIIVSGVYYLFIDEKNCNTSIYTEEFQIVMYGGYRGNENIVEELNSEEYRIVNTYEEYVSLIEKIILTNTHTYTGDVSPKVDMEFKKSFFEDKNLIAITATANNNVVLKSYEEIGSTATISVKEVWKGTLAVQNYMIFIPANKNIINVDVDIIEEDLPSLSIPGYAEKPIIYLYPTEETRVNVRLKNYENITCSYPKYKENGWNVIAKPNGDLTDIETGRNLYSLYWEGKNENAKMNMQEGFVVKGEDTIKFLEEKLEILGLNERESEEFIIYWLPKLEKNKYNYIRFATKEEINQNMPLEINPKPDTIIRVLMEFKRLDKYIEIPEQKLETPTREGFVAVEWGGIELK